MTTRFILSSFTPRAGAYIAASSVAVGALASTSAPSIVEGDNPVADAVTSARRFAVATRHFAPMYFDYRAHRARVRALGADPTEDEVRASRQIMWARVAERLRDLARAQGGIYVKAGQHIAAQPVAPLPFQKILRVLMDDASERPFAEDALTFREEIGADVDEAFASFDKIPVASASLAQVYRARTFAGEEVAVKIQQRPVAKFLQSDLSTIEGYYSLLAWLIPGLRFQWLANETRRHMAEELDFTSEAANSLKAARMLARDFGDDELHIPRVHRRLSGKRVLTMEWCEGNRIDDVAALEKNGVDVEAVAARIQKIFAKMLFVNGFVHVDPHPGNVLVDKNGRIVLLDHGVYRTLDDDLRRKWCNVWLALIRSDDSALRDATASLGVNPDMSQFFKLILALVPTKVIEDPLVKPSESETTHKSTMDTLTPAGKRMIFRQIMGVRLEDQSQLFENLPRDLLLVLKANNLLRYINEQLGSPVNRYKYIASSATEGLLSTSSGATDTTGVSTINRGAFARVRERLGDAWAISLLPLQLLLLKGQLAWAFWKMGKKQAASATLQVYSSSNSASSTTPPKQA